MQSALHGRIIFPLKLVSKYPTKKISILDFYLFMNLLLDLDFFHFEDPAEPLLKLL